MRVVKFLIIVVIICCFCGSVRAQAENRQRVLKELYALQKLYADQQALSFSIKYSYADEGKPNVILDSLSGEMLLQKNGYRHRIDKTETVRNDKYTIIMFEEDSLMHISASRKALNDPANPTAMIDSSILNLPGTKFGLSVSNNTKEITLEFPSDMPYKSIRLFIDVATGFVQRTVMVMKTSFMTDVAEGDLRLPDYYEYAIVQTTFSNYKTVEKTADELNEKSFFTRTGKEFTPTERYKNYKVFIGTPNL